MLTIISVGKDHDPAFKEAISLFENRLGHYSKFSWLLIKPSGYEGLKARAEESEKILKIINPQDFVVVLDENGALVTSPDIASLIESCQNSSQKIVIVIGGAYGIDQTVLTRANKTISFGRVVFPHQLVRIMALEQLYRAHSILAGSNYHHE